MMRRLATMRAAAAALAVAIVVAARPAPAQPPAPRSAPAGAPVARFDWFEYSGRDAVNAAHPVRAGEFRNPILAGFYPDPSITRAGDEYYLVSSTFSWFPGIPIFRSRDLVSWTQVGNAIHRPEQMRFDSLGISRGIFAPAIAHHDGKFWIVSTCVGCGGNFLITATDAAGPWSDPIWLGMEGIDPSLYFDEDGKIYVVNNRAPVGPPRYPGHRAIWLQEYDPQARRLVGEATLLVDGGIDITTRPPWIEGPHIYKVDGRFYLVAAEGGTAIGHRQVVLRADRLRGPYVPGPQREILTQRHLDPARPFPVTSTGHADFVQTPAGDWWTVFLGIRPYEEDYHNIGRETFLLPVRWVDGWPTVVGGLAPVPYAAARPALPAQPAPRVPTTGDFTVRDEFDAPALPLQWMTIRTPHSAWWTLGGGALALTARPDSLGGLGQPSFLGRRQQHQRATATTAMRWTPTRDGDVAGLAAFQGDANFYLLGVTRTGGVPEVQVRARGGAGDSVRVLARAPLPRLAANAPVRLRIEVDGARMHFSVADASGRWRPVLRDADARQLSGRRSGGGGGSFTGVVLGVYAHAAAEGGR